MSREHPTPEPETPPEPTGRIEVTGPGPLVLVGLLGLVLGWGLHWLAIRNGSPAPGVGALIIAVTWFIALLTAVIAFLTRRTVRVERAGLTAQEGVFRLVLGKTIARFAALALGGFVGVVISRLGVAGEHSGETIVRALIAALGAAAGLAAGLLLEHACRVPPGPQGDLP